MIPDYLKNHLTKIKEKKYTTTAILTSSAGNTDLEIYYYGILDGKGKFPFIMPKEFPYLITAKDPKTNEEFIVFDEAIHGYDAMFVNEYIPNLERKLTKYQAGSGKIQISLSYSIDYEDEKDEFEFTSNKEVKVMYGTLNFDLVKSIGYDWISLRFVGKRKYFLDVELA